MKDFWEWRSRGKSGDISGDPRFVLYPITFKLYTFSTQPRYDHNL